LGGRRHVGRALAGTAILVLLASGCGIQEKKENADRIRDSIEKLAEQGTASARLTFSITVIDRPRDAAGAPILQQAVEGMRTPEVATELALDYRQRLAQTALPSASPDQPAIAFQVFAGDVIYQRRLNQGGEGTTGGRQWVMLDFGDQYDDRENKHAQGFGTQGLNPAWLVDLVGGALMGSVEEAGADDVGGVPTTRYRVNFSWDDAFDDVDEDERDGFIAASTMLGIPEKVVKGEIWLDADGLPRRIRADVRQQRDRNEELELHYTLELLEFGVAAEIAIPGGDEVSEVTDLGGIMQATNPLGNLGP
jgi:hypothetical protein